MQACVHCRRCGEGAVSHTVPDGPHLSEVKGEPRGSQPPSDPPPPLVLFLCPWVRCADNDGTFPLLYETDKHSALLLFDVNHLKSSLHQWCRKREKERESET